jgi:hypothetical protein
MRTIRLPLTILSVFGTLMLTGCGAKGDPKPNPRLPPLSCAVRAIDTKTIEATLPTEDIQGNRLLAIESVRVYYLPLKNRFPSPLEVFQQGETILERRRPNLPSPGKRVTLDLSHFGRPSGWLVVVSFRVGEIAGAPSQVLPWVDPSF